MKAKYVLAATIIASTSVAVQAQSVTYDFTGTVSSSSGAVGSLTSGSVITGTYTFDIAAGIPAVSSGTVGDQAGEWYIQDEGGSALSLPKPNASVFSDTLTGGGFSFSSGPLGSVLSDTYVLGFGNSFSGPAYVTSAINNYSFSTGAFSSSGFTLEEDGTNFSVPYTSQGLPIFLGNTFFAGGYVQSQNAAGSFQEVNYTITSLTPISAVPEPPTYLSMVFGLGIVGLLLTGQMRRKLSASLRYR